MTNRTRRFLRGSVGEGLARVRGFLLQGDKIECPCCGRTFRIFMYSPHLTALCPYCKSYERYRLLCLFLRDKTDLNSRKMRLLDIGPIRCFQVYCESLENVEYTAIDIASPLADYLMDITSLEFDNGTFDCIICYHVLEHIEDDSKALDELHRVLKPDGWAIIQVPLDKKGVTVERSSLSKDEQDDILKWPAHLRHYGKDFSGRLKSAGFNVKISDYVKQFTGDQINYYGLDGNEDIYFCSK